MKWNKTKSTFCNNLDQEKKTPDYQSYQTQ